MNQGHTITRRMHAASVLRGGLMQGVWLAAMIVATAFAADRAAAATISAPTPESVGREALLDALAPALAARGATASVTVSEPDARRTLAPCNQLTAALPPGARLAGKTVVAVRCNDGANWQTFLTAEVRVEAPIWQTTHALRAGETINGGDVVMTTAVMSAADLEVATSAARVGTTTNGSTAANRGLASLDGRVPAPIGRIVQRPVAMGRALTASDVRDEGRINPGDAVRVVYTGDGFSVSSEGRSVGAGDPGTTISIRLASGALVNGTLRADHLVELPR
jgi:flagella basal body P-ring formation protein FlgA